MASNHDSKNKTNKNYPAVLTIAGSDPSGGAGIQADLKTFTALGCYGATVITALTAQNTKGVQDVCPTPLEFFERQLGSVLEDIEFSAIKTGMLYGPEHVRAVVKALKRHYTDKGKPVPPLVVDPVCVSTSGHKLLSEDAISIMLNELCPLAILITPNIPEAEMLMSSSGATEHELKPIKTFASAMQASRALPGLSPNPVNVLLKGGHLDIRTSQVPEQNAADDGLEVLSAGQEQAGNADVNDEEVVPDLFFDHRTHDLHALSYPRIKSTSTHGTGCTLSAAIACFLALGHPLFESVALGRRYTYQGIEAAFSIGSGHGPLNHMHSITQRQVPLPSKADAYPFTRSLIKSNMAVWRQYVQHTFVKQLGAGTLPKENFLHFVKQDYHYLKYYARAYGLLIAKTRNFADIKPAADTILNVLNEVSLHRTYCSTELGISSAELEATPESAATTAYGSYLLDAGVSGDEKKLIVALGACLLGYGEVGLWLKKEARRDDTWVKWEGNPYLKWMEDYSGEGYQNAVKTGLGILEECALRDPPSTTRYAEYTEIWGKCTLLEKQFWDMAITLS